MIFEELERNMNRLFPSSPEPKRAFPEQGLRGLSVTETNMDEWNSVFGEFKDIEPPAGSQPEGHQREA
jgi:hypothetical protein